MNESLQHLIEALREELKQYGEMLALFDHQQELVVRRQTPDLLQSVHAINAQADTIHATRREREQRQRHVARQFELPEDAGFGALIPKMPADYRPLVEALVLENNELLIRVQHRARQNHNLLSRVVELMQQFLCSILPTAPTTYSEQGHRLGAGIPERSIYDAVG